MEIRVKTKRETGSYVMLAFDCLLKLPAMDMNENEKAR